ncbi:putative snorna binding protein [Phaeomoniella chlamydospora]|uniref:Putative snorna binding protein n=1 Tax=Phaeomoniella chlamydospora TaxID=158046 RepID=A0A0G2EY24_PHACM|nr:putative snorna binding protein [Phaeomoniella chlamydospora]
MPALEDDFAQPLAKRQKLANGSKRGPNGSRIFAPYRTLGLVSPTSVPFTTVPLGKTTFQVTTSIGRTIQTHDLARGLNLVFLSRPRTPANITATCAYKDRIFVAWGGNNKDRGRGVWVFKRGKLLGELEPPSRVDEPTNRLLVLGAWLVGCGSRSVEVWNSETLEHYTTLTPSSSGTGETLSGSICALPTFLNKVFIGRKDGNVEVWNLSTGRLIHTLLPSSSKRGSITALEPTPALSILAIAYADGSITIRNVETDEVLLEFQQKSLVTSISFRTDGLGAGNDGRDEGIMATGSVESGDVTFWDLNEGGKVKGILRGAHNKLSSRDTSGITKIQFLPGQPVLLSSGSDNSLKSWIFDEVPFSPLPRPLHSRSGHSAPIIRLLFTPTGSDEADAVGKWILSSSQDRTLWCFSTRRDGQNTEVSQGQVKTKAKKSGDTLEDLRTPEITSIACCLNRDGGMGSTNVSKPWSNIKTTNAEEANQIGWESIITTHRGDRFARTWSWGRRKAGRWTFETSDKTEASSTCITACGTFALVGSSGGSLDMFNLQSGMHRQRFPPRLNPNEVKQQRLKALQDGHDDITSSAAHDRELTGVAVDNLNEHVISCGLDGAVKIWDFKTGKLIGHIKMPYSASITALKYNSIAGLVSVSCDDFCVRLVDVETRRIVRELWGAGGQIYDHCFSSDGRWIVACSMDSIVRIWDLSTGSLIDAFRTATTCTSLAFSSSGEYLATAHSNESGIELWTNKSLYTHIPVHEIHDIQGVIDLSEIDPTVSSTGVLPAQDEDVVPPGGLDEGQTIPDDLDNEISSDLLTLSIVPRTRWETLLHLDTIKERNKPREGPKQPQKAPFFLQSGNAAAPENTDQQGSSRVSRLELTNSQRSKFTELLASSAVSFQFDALIQELASLSPAAADLEIRSLQLSELEYFVRAMTARLQDRKDYELVNTWMTCFIRLHGDFIEENDALQAAITKWRSVLKDEERRLSTVIGYCSGVIDFLRSGR